MTAPEISDPRAPGVGKCPESEDGVPSCPLCGVRLMELAWDEPSLLPDGTTAHFCVFWCPACGQAVEP